jgi:alcohol dehydrogenase
VADSWGFNNPVTITFGPGTLAQIGEVLDGRSYALITYNQRIFREMTARIAEIAGPPAVTVDNVVTNPDFRALEESCTRFAAFDPAPEAIVALGGGSVMDAAKVLAAGRDDFAKLRHFVETGKGVEYLRSIPVIAVPTTAGSGSEVTSWATLWDLESGKKYSLSLPDLFPEHALVDPELTLSLPPEVTISSGLDALSHALESLWNVNANPLTRDFAVTAAREIMMTLPIVVQEPGDVALRCRVSRAALFAGLAFSNTRTALAHALSYPITLRHGVAHGIACSFSLPMVMRAAVGVSEDCDTALRRIFGADLEAGADWLAGFLMGLGVSVDPADYGVTEWDWQVLIDLAFEHERGKNFIGERRKLTTAGAGNRD